MKYKRIYSSADWHITVSVPQGRKETEEEWFEVQKDHVRQVAQIVKEDLLIISGDIIDVWMPREAEKILNMLHDELPPNTIWILGNHEGRGTSQDMQRALSEGTAGTLSRMQGLTYLKDGDVFSWGDYNIYPSNFANGKTLKHYEVDPAKTNIAIGHFLSFEKQIPHWGEGEAVLAKDIVKDFPEYDFIIVGDNHTTFNYKDKYVSPGSLTRRTVNQIKHKPSICCYDGEMVHFIQLDVKPAEDCITTEHIDKNKKQKQMKEDMKNWTEDLANQEDASEITGSFEEVVTRVMIKEKVKQNVRNRMNNIITKVKEK